MILIFYNVEFYFSLYCTDFFLLKHKTRNINVKKFRTYMNIAIYDREFERF